METEREKEYELLKESEIENAFQYSVPENEGEEFNFTQLSETQILIQVLDTVVQLLSYWIQWNIRLLPLSFFFRSFYLALFFCLPTFQ